MEPDQVSSLADSALLVLAFLTAVTSLVGETWNKERGVLTGRGWLSIALFVGVLAFGIIGRMANDELSDQELVRQRQAAENEKEIITTNHQTEVEHLKRTEEYLAQVVRIMASSTNVRKLVVEANFLTKMPDLSKTTGWHIWVKYHGLHPNQNAVLYIDHEGAFLYDPEYFEEIERLTVSYLTRDEVPSELRIDFQWESLYHEPTATWVLGKQSTPSGITQFSWENYSSVDIQLPMKGLRFEARPKIDFRFLNALSETEAVTFVFVAERSIPLLNWPPRKPREPKHFISDVTVGSAGHWKAKITTDLIEHDFGKAKISTKNRVPVQILSDQ